MASLKVILYLCVCLSAWIITADSNQAVNVHWISLDFKTVLTWTITVPGQTYSIRYSEDNADWQDCPDCTNVAETECDMTTHVSYFDRTYTADIITELEEEEESPHTLSPSFNPYKQTQISAVNFTVEAEGDRVTVSVMDLLSGIHKRGKQLTIRDIFKTDLKYKMRYHKSGSTGRRELIFDDSLVNVSGLDEGESYCFMIAAFIPTRAANTQLGAWSEQKCIQSETNPLKQLSLASWVVIIFVFILLIIIIVVTIVCCRHCRNKNRFHQIAQRPSALI